MSGLRRTVFRPLDPDFVEDPYPTYDRLRREHPIGWATTPAQGYAGFWFVSRYADVNAGLKDDRFGREVAKVLPPEAFVPILEAHRPLYAMIAQWMLFKDPPDHARLRRIAAPVFALRQVNAMRPRIEALIEAAFAQVPEYGPFDIISDFSSPLSIDIVSDLMGVPEEDHPLVRGWVREITLSLDLVRTPERIAAGSRRAAELVAYFGALVCARRAKPKDDFLGLLIAAHDAGSFLTEEELLASCVLFLFAGHEASSLLIGNGLHALAQNPAEYARLRAGETQGRLVVSELLRYDSPQQIAFRHALEDVDFLGVSIRRGQTVGFGLGSANRDPDIFADPDRLDLSRQETRHLAFGAGIHTCAGSSLANIEAEMVFAVIARRFPRIEIIAAQRQESILVRGLTRLVIDCG
ncbi:cytochrome P450 [Falsiroseomonas stagni]|uniref:Cytochrome P450 n=1 Tax=Falsiroseomonas stagni DSM 19981 TaxID=1123062 RepID=A0A1I3ZKT1_9PROT|nr:cytochrome P450 [Falsiroseomonas stagni]SFK44647.1 Cytochrome P450 [Falsiroseomonas stagni DSM 19981]